MGRVEAAEQIWEWREQSPETSAPTSHTRARIRGTLQAAAGGVAGSFFLWLGWTLPAWAVLSTATLILVSALFSPGGVYATLERMLVAIAQRLGRALTWVLMVLLFYLFFTPFGMVFRRGKRDSMKRFFDSEAETYWEPHEGLTAASTSHESQF